MKGENQNGEADSYSGRKDFIPLVQWENVCAQAKQRYRAIFLSQEAVLDIRTPPAPSPCFLTLFHTVPTTKPK